jgi:hypothetical protein
MLQLTPETLSMQHFTASHWLAEAAAPGNEITSKSTIPRAGIPF